MRATRDTAAGRVYLDLQAKAKAEGQSTDALLTLYALEGFLARLAASDHRDKLVLKGGVLLAAVLVRRPTRDVDLQAQVVPNEVKCVLDIVRGVAAGEPVGGIDDGLVFGAAQATAEVIRDEDAYSVVRVSLRCTLLTARIRFHIDVNVGDSSSPESESVELPRLLGGSVTLRSYPMPMVHAERLVPAIDRGAAGVPAPATPAPDLSQHGHLPNSCCRDVEVRRRVR